MERSVAFNEKEIQKTFRYILDKVSGMDQEIRMMEEQGLGLRDNLDWRSSGRRLRIDLEQLKIGLNYFGVEHTDAVNLNEYNYEICHLRPVEQNY
jgi:hypothetical protein